MSVDVHLRGRRVAVLSREGDGYGLAYDAGAVRRLGEDAARLSVSLPPRREPYDHAATRPYIEGLLPRGNRRRRIAHELRLDPDDGYGLIAELGRDCPGAVTFAPGGSDDADAAGAPAAGEEPAWLEPDELAEVLDFPPERCFDPERPQRMRFTLAGERHKLALLRDEETGRWAWPSPGAPSTHIVVPESGLHPELALNEFFCTESLRALGMPAPHSTVEQLGGRLCLVSERFDRWGSGVGAERLHQESFEQAAGIAPDAELDPICSLVRSAELLHAIGEPDFRKQFFSVAFCRWALGDLDERHTARVALLHEKGGPLPALFYGIASTAVYEPEGTKAPLREVAERCSPVIGMAKPGIGLMLTMEESVRLGARNLHDLNVLLEGVSARAVDEGWHEPVIDLIQERVARRVQFLHEEPTNPPSA